MEQELRVNQLTGRLVGVIDEEGGDLDVECADRRE